MFLLKTNKIPLVLLYVLGVSFLFQIILIFALRSGIVSHVFNCFLGKAGMRGIFIVKVI